MTYTIKFTPDEVVAMRFAYGRYDWPELLLDHLQEDELTVVMPEHVAWEWRDRCDEEDSLYSLASPELAIKLHKLAEDIV